MAKIKEPARPVRTARPGGRLGGFDISVIPYFLKVGRKHYWVDYDEETDTLYISFRKPQCADDSRMHNDLIYHYADKELVGITVLNAKTVRKQSRKGKICH